MCVWPVHVTEKHVIRCICLCTISIYSYIRLQRQIIFVLTCHMIFNATIEYSQLSRLAQKRDISN